MRRFRIYQKNNNFFSNLTPRGHDVHFWRQRVKSNDYSQILPKDAECNCYQYSRKKWAIFFAIWPLAAIQKAKNCHFSQISELTQTMQIIYQNEALGISFSEKLISRSFEVTQGQKSRKKGQISIFFKVGK